MKLVISVILAAFLAACVGTPVQSKVENVQGGFGQNVVDGSGNQVVNSGGDVAPGGPAE